MAQLSERLQFLITADGASAISAFQNVGNAADKELTRASDKLDRTGAKLTKFGTAALGSSLVVGAGLGKLASGASDLSETVSKSNVVFGSAAREVEEFGDRAAKAIGQSKQAAIDAASTFGVFGKAAGLTGSDLAKFSTELVTLSSDLASFGNSTPEEAVEALGQALRGENEGMRKYGVLLDDATLKARALEMGLISTTTGTLPPAIKVQAAYREILAQTTMAQGDFDRTSQGAANQQRILRAELKNLSDGIGTGVLPAFTGMISLTGGVVGKLNEMSPAAKAALGSLAAGGAGITGAVGGISLVAGQLVKLRGRFLETVDGATSFTTAGKVAAAATVGIGLFSTAVALIRKESADAKARVDDLRTSVASTGRTAGEAAAEQIFKFVQETKNARIAMEGAGLTSDELRDAVLGGGESFEAAKKKIEAWGKGLDKKVAALQLIGAIEDQRKAVADLTKETENEQRARIASTATTDRAAESASRDAKEKALLGAAVRDLGKDTEDLADSYDTAKEHAKLLADVEKDLADKQKAVADRIRDTTAAGLEALSPELNYRESVRATGRALDDARTAHEEAAKERSDPEKQRKAEEAEDAIAKAILAEAEAWVINRGKTLESEDGAQDYRNKLGELVGQVRAEFPGVAAMLQTQIDRWAGIREQIRLANAESQTYAKSAPGFENFGKPGGPAMRAAGGPVNMGETYLVGENGPELFVSNTNGAIVPNHALTAGGASSGGGARPIVINVTTGTPAQAGRAIVDAIAAYERSHGKGWRS